MAVPSALSVSAADPGGGLLHADLLAFDVLGVVGAGVVSASTPGGSRSAGEVHELPVGALRAALEAALAGLPSAAKIGVLTSVPAVRAVARALAAAGLPLVVDPGFGPRSGVRLVRATVLEAIVRDLFPAAALVTLSLVEAAALSGFAIRDEADAKAAARRIQALGPSAILLTGGCAEGPRVVDGLLDGRTWHRFETARIEAPPGCGAGGLLSAAATAFLALGETPPDAVARALDFVRRSLLAGWPTAPLHPPAERRT